MWKKGSIKSRIMVISGVIMVFLIVGISVAAPYLGLHDPIRPVGPRHSPPNAEFIMGTTKLGYDIFSRCIFGSQTVLLLGPLASAIALVIGLPVGLLAGYFGGKLDYFTVMVMDSLYSFPGLLLAIVVVAVLGPGMFNAALAVVVVFAPQYFRVVRNHTISVKQETFVESSRAIGAPIVRILRLDILPNVIYSVPPLVSSNIGSAILVLVGLSFLGLGVTPPEPNLGYDMGVAQRFIGNGIWWQAFFPGLFVVVIITGFSLLGEGLSEILNPRV
jgi:peptide/nickel transport system permease protein